MLVDAVRAVEVEHLLLHEEAYLHERGVLVAYAVLESILDNADEQQGWKKHTLPVLLGQFEADVYLPARIAFPHQFHVVGNEPRLLG